ncbi:MAG: S-layer homology domain-containing protein [Actinobacteria bacterium]|nr:S-layer homology domain-containing protein [Actinomycetota bacterium]
MLNRFLLLAAIAIVALVGVLVATTGLASTSYKDVPTGAWYAPYLDLDSISGYPDGTFRGEKLVTRAEFAKIIIAAINESPSGSPSSFTDVTSDYWARGYIERAKELRIIGGYADGTFKPTNYVTRQEAAKIIVLAKNIAPVAYRGEFSDVSSSMWSAQYIQAAKDAGIISGYPDGTFKPTGQTARMQAAKMVYVMIHGSDVTTTTTLPSTTTTTKLTTTTTIPKGSDSTIVYITATGTKYHRDGCRYLVKSKIAITLGEAKSQGYGPCSVCDPPQ